MQRSQFRDHVAGDRLRRAAARVVGEPITVSGPNHVVIAHHLIWTAYGYWLPNDPRGSTSKTIACDVIAELGSLHFGRKRVQPSGREVKEFQDRSRAVLKYPLLKFQVADFPLIADALTIVIREHNYTCYACAIMPDHVHVLIRKHKHVAEDMLEHFQTVSRLRLRNRGGTLGRPSRLGWSRVESVSRYPR